MTHSNNMKQLMKGSTMRSFGIIVIGLLVAAGCNRQQSDINRVQTNLIDKSVFEGEWWYSQTAIDVDSDEDMLTGEFTGAMAWADLGVDGGSSGSVARIRWVVDQNYLFAYRAYELIDGGNDDGREERFRGQPLAAWRILGHVDVRRDYNTGTGEETNVIVENTSDRDWYERQYVRVDWSQNVISTFFYTSLSFGPYIGYRAEPGSFFFQENAHDEFPASWYPQYVRIGDDPAYRFAGEWPADQADTVHYMSFVTQSLLSPGANCLYYGSPCQTAAITYRHSFLRVPPGHSYASSTETHDEYDRFGLFRTMQRTYVRGGRSRDDQPRSCTVPCAADEHCGVGGACDFASGRCAGGEVDHYFACGGGVCDTGAGFCAGGLTGDYGETDFLTFYTPRYNIFANSLTDTRCLTDSECSGTNGSECDRAAQRCTVPVAERSLRRLTDAREGEAAGSVAYWLNPGFPEYQVPEAYMVIGRWNEIFMEGWRAARREAIPDYSVASVSCQNSDPTDYCFCGSAEDRGGSCTGIYDPFVTPAEYESQGVVAPYDCYVDRGGWSEPASPSSYDEYEGTYNLHFVGAECLLVLRSNSCNVDPTQRCEELGDLRYQFFNYIPESQMGFGGVSIPLSDPKSGELISSNANMAAPSVESAIMTAVEYFPVLRGEPGAEERWFTGENLRGYFDRLGRTEHPVALASGGDDGYTVDDPSRPAIPANLNAHLLEHIAGRMEHIEPLRGSDGRAMLMTDRMRLLAGTDIERRLVGSLGPDGMDALDHHTDRTQLPTTTSALDEEMLDRFSPFRGNGFMDTLSDYEEDIARMGRMSYCFPAGELYKSTNWQYWANAFGGRPAEEASIRMQQLYLRNVMYHEIGHSVGLNHNFGSSFDRNNYSDAYFPNAQELPLPRLQDFDTPEQGGDANGFVGGEEVDRYVAELRRVRDERSSRGMFDSMNASAMDYTSITSTVLGRYDKAATVWSYFGQLEAFESGDPRITSTDSLDGLTRSNEIPRTWWQYYRGGESCLLDNDCPYGPESGLLAGDQPVHQRCIQNPRYERLPTPCAGERNCVCSPFEEDFKDYEDGVAYLPPDTRASFSSVRYLFCNDSRVDDISWCTRSDQGESFQESVDAYRQMWEEAYPGAYFRRFRRFGGQGFATYGGVVTAAKIYQHLFFRLFFEPGFGSNEGPLGFNDQFLASVDAMNWFIEIFNAPDIGSYAYDAGTDRFEHLGEAMDMPGAQFNLEPGAGFAMWSRYQEGHEGFNRVERAGTFYDKFFALYALALRDWGFSYTVDERYFINFYDLFDVEMTEFFGGVVQDDPHWFAPRVRMVDGEPHVQHLSWYRGLTLQECRRSGRAVPCRGPQEEVYTEPPLTGTTNQVLRSWGTILALAFFPVFYDTTFEQRLSIFKLDSGDGYTFPDLRPDGTPQCSYGPVTLSPVHTTGCAREDADYVVYESERFHTPYVATKIFSRITFNLEEEQTGFQLLANMLDKQSRIRELTALPTPTPDQRRELETLTDELQQDESYLEYLIDVQRSFGISSWL